MFSLIITIISIALVVALVAATMYHGDDTLTKGKGEAEVAKAVNELGQIKAALVAHNATEGEKAATMSDLIPAYLASAPAGWGVDIPNSIVFESKAFQYGTEEQNREACLNVNLRLGLTGAVPACEDVASNFFGCCESPDAVVPGP